MYSVGVFSRNLNYHSLRKLVPDPSDETLLCCALSTCPFATPRTPILTRQSGHGG